MYCPSCGSEYREGYTECTDCKVPLVEGLPTTPQKRRAPMFPTIPKLPDDRPLLIRVIPYLAFIMGGGAVLLMLLALCDVGTLTSSGRVISREEFLSQAVLPSSITALLYFTVAFSFWREALWSRHILVACLALMATWELKSGHGGTSSFGLGFVTLEVGIPSGVFVLAFALWYLYVKASVRAYYRNLKVSGAAVREQPSNAGPQTDI